MTALRYVGTVIAAAFSVSLSLAAQQPSGAGPSTPETIRQSLFVDTKSGQPVTDLDQKDFTVLDNKTARPITSFKRLDPAGEPVNVILLLDAVNAPYNTVAYARGEMEKFLKLNGGRLANPTAIAVLTDRGGQISKGFTTDGAALSNALDHFTIGLRNITRTTDWSGPERLELCVKTLHQLISALAPIPGRKMMIWISPGWPLVSGPRVYLDTRQAQQIFSEVVTMSTRLRDSRITMYDVNPIGVGESLWRADLYQSYMKGVAKFDKVDQGDLAIQVLAVQSGGLAIESDSDVSGMIEKCLNDAKSWYEIAFDPLPADGQNQYHHTEVKVDRPGVVVRTRDGYYANPVAITAR